MNYYQFHIADFALHTSHLSLEEEAVYRRLLDFYYDTESPIPTETQPVIRRLRLGLHSDVVASILVEFFVSESDGWHNLRADIEINDYHKKADRARENGKNGGRPKKNNPAITKRVIFNNPEITGSKANQEPRTINQEPLTKVKKAPSKLVKPTIHELITEFGNRVTDSETQAEKFLAYYESNGWKIGKNPMKSWRATVTTWVTRSKENANHSGISAITGFPAPGCAGKISTVDRNGLAADNYRQKLQLQYEAEDHNGHFVGAPGSDLRG